MLRAVLHTVLCEQSTVRGCVPQPLQDLQCGRDAGTPSYNAVREALGLAPAESFEQVQHTIDTASTTSTTSLLLSE